MLGPLAIVIVNVMVFGEVDKIPGSCALDSLADETWLADVHVADVFKATGGQSVLCRI